MNRPLYFNIPTWNILYRTQIVLNLRTAMFRKILPNMTFAKKQDQARTRHYKQTKSLFTRHGFNLSKNEVSLSHGMKILRDKFIAHDNFLSIVTD